MTRTDMTAVDGDSSHGEGRAPCVALVVYVKKFIHFYGTRVTNSVFLLPFLFVLFFSKILFVS